MIELSFIVPVYNTEEYISRCLNSLVNQNIPVADYEIIVINDGSTDNSFAILNEYASKYSNIIVLNQNNKGLSATRNSGVVVAKGKYLWHIDSDDWIVENCINELLKICRNDDLDMLEVAPSISVSQDFVNDIQANPYSRIYSGKELLVNQKAVIGTWAYLIKRDFILQNSLLFFPGIQNDDVEFTPRALYFASHVRLMNFSVYYYFQRGGSIVHSFSENRLFQYLKISKSLKNFGLTTVKEKNIQKIFFFISNGIFIAGISAISTHHFTKKVLHQYLQEAKQNKIYPLKLEYRPFKRFLIILLVNWSPVLFIRLRGKFNGQE